MRHGGTGLAAADDEDARGGGQGIAEGAGEDTFLGRALAVARVQGFQASDLTSGRRVVACPKHYVGYGAAEGWPGWWGMESPEYLEWLDRSPEKDNPILMGSTTYRLMSTLATSGEPGVDTLDAVPKVVFSSTLTEPLAWANSTLVTTDAVAAVRAMKQDSDLPLRTLGSVSLCRSLLRAGLVDRYRVVVFPVITGATGTDRIFDGYPDVRLELTESRTYAVRGASRAAVLHRSGAGDPGETSVVGAARWGRRHEVIVALAILVTISAKESS